MGLRSILTLWFLLAPYLVDVFSEHSEYYDAVVIEAADEPPRPRTRRQVQDDARQYYLGQLPGASSLLAGPCFTSKGVVGRCLSFRQCYPFFKLPDLNTWDSWILGMYDTCSYFTPQGRQMFGVCCTNPISTSTETPSTTGAPTTVEQNPDSAKFPNYPNWPPPLPTHSPDNTIPPLPTHPHPHPTPAIEVPLPTTTRKPSTAVFPGWPVQTTTSGWPTQPSTTSYPGWPPVQTTTTTSAPPPVVPVSDGTCGAKNGYQDQERIVGGHNADLGEWPWIAGLFNGGRQFCGGSLIDDIHILSAAHCVAHMSSWDVARLTVRLGDHNIKTNAETNHVELKVKRVVRHKGFDARTLYYDVSLITMESPVKFTQYIRPICLPSSTGESYAGVTATVIGWGSLRESGPQPSVLQEVNIPIWSNTECRYKYGAAAPGGIVEHMLCAGQATRDSCSGDSGGPLMVNSGKWTQVGIVSWGIGCGKGQYPGVYSRVQAFLPWIYKNLK